MRIRWTLAVCSALWLIAPASAPAQEAPGTDPVAALRQEIEALKQTYETRITELERRLAGLEAVAKPTEDDELAALRAAAQETAGQAPAPETSEAEIPEARDVASGNERNLNRLNPEISMTGDLVGFTTDQGREDFNGREFELNVQSALDPYSRPSGRSRSLPRRGWTSRRATWPTRAFPGADAHRRQVPPGVRRAQPVAPPRPPPDRLSPRPPDVLRGGGARPDRPFGLLATAPPLGHGQRADPPGDGRRERRFRRREFFESRGARPSQELLGGRRRDLRRAGPFRHRRDNGSGGESRVYGTDFTLHWQPPQRAKYREVTWRTELLRSERADESGEPQKAWGGYSYVESLVAQNLYAECATTAWKTPSTPGACAGASSRTSPGGRANSSACAGSMGS